MSSPTDQAAQPLHYTYHAMDVRIVTGADGEPWFVALDVAHVLGYSSTGALNRSLEEDEKGVQSMHTPGGSQRMSTITESGLYHAIFHSRRPEAESFRKWVTGEVLPEIRRTGGYGVPDLSRLSRGEILEQMHQAVLAGKEAEAEAQRLAIENNRMRPYAELGEAVSGSDDSRSVGETAQALGVGQNKLFQWLRELGVLIPQGERKNLPYQEHIDAGRFEVREVPYTAGSRQLTRRKTLVTGRGDGYIQRRLVRAGILESAQDAAE